MLNINTILVASLFFRAAVGLVEHYSTLFKQTQTSENGLSYTYMIACAFRASDGIFSDFRVNEETGQCEGQDGLQMIRTPYPLGFEYYKREAHFITYSRLKFQCKREVMHQPFSKVKLRNKFHFVFKKAKTDRLIIIFKDITKSKLVIFQALEAVCLMLDQYEGVKGRFEFKTYPFSAFKVYNITFEVLESYWQTFGHRHQYKDITGIFVSTGPNIDYLTKYQN